MPTADYSSYHQASGTGADGTKFSNFIDAVQATNNSLDKNNLAANAGILASQLADPTAGKVLGSSGGACAAVVPPGYELNYTQITANANVTDTVEATATALLSPGAITFDGAPVLVHFFCPDVVLDNANAGDLLVVTLWEGATQIGRLALIEQPSITSRMTVPVSAFYRFTPTAASHTYKVCAFTTSTTGTPTLTAGSGGTGAFLPTFVRFTKV